MLEGCRVVAVFCLVFLLTETGVKMVTELTGWCGQPGGPTADTVTGQVRLGYTKIERLVWTAWWSYS